MLMVMLVGGAYEKLFGSLNVVFCTFKIFWVGFCIEEMLPKSC